MPMKIRTLDHVSLLVRDAERSRQFYSQILGMEEIPRPASFNFPGAWLRQGSALIHLIEEDEAGRVDQLYPGTYNQEELLRGHANHTAFEVDDLDEVQRHFASHHIEIVGGPKPRGDGVAQLYIRDPDGHLLEFFAWQ